MMVFGVRLFDPKLKRYFRSYLGQSLLATLVLFVVLLLQHLPTHSAIIASIGATTFILFATPGYPRAMPRRVVGGHFIGLLLGGAFAAFNGTGLGQGLLADVPMFLSIEAAAAVGLTIFGMVATDTEHAPAGGTALAMVVEPFSWGLVGFVVSSVVALSLAHRILRPWLRDLI